MTILNQTLPIALRHTSTRCLTPAGHNTTVPLIGITDQYSIVQLRDGSRLNPSVLNHSLTRLFFTWQFYGSTKQYIIRPHLCVTHIDLHNKNVWGYNCIPRTILSSTVPPGVLLRITEQNRSVRYITSASLGLASLYGSTAVHNPAMPYDSIAELQLSLRHKPPQCDTSPLRNASERFPTPHLCCLSLL